MEKRVIRMKEKVCNVREIRGKGEGEVQMDEKGY